MSEHELIAAQELDDNFEPNRKQRRDYVRINQNRVGRRTLVGFGRWRRHNYLLRQDYPVLNRRVAQPVRRVRRPGMIRQAKVARRIWREASRVG